MYLQHFALTEMPFGLTPDTQFFYELATHREALNVLLIALQNGEGFIKITGPVGSGKTMLCRKLLNELQTPFISAYLPNPNFSSEELHMAIMDELGLKSHHNSSQNRLLKQLNKHLIKTASQGKKTVLIIDEAQAMSIESLEALRLLTNLETEKQKLMQIVLFGQSELDQLLNNKAIRQLRQRITFSYKLRPLTRLETRAYLQHRLQVAGNDKPLFSKTACRLLHFYSRGIPRLANTLAHKALLSAFGKGHQNIGLRHVQMAALDSKESQHRSQWLSVDKKYILLLMLALLVYHSQSQLLQ